MYYYTYMLRCKDNSIYTGITNDINKRMAAHFLKKGSGAKYTKSHDAQKVEAVWRTKEKVLACKLEYHIKTLTKKQKEDLIINGNLKEYFCGFDGRKFSKVNLKEYEFTT